MALPHLMAEESNQAWLPLWARVVSVLGFPTVVAFLLLAVVLGWVKSPLTDVAALQQRQIEIMAQSLAHNRQAQYEERAVLEYQNVLLRTLCKNFAKDTAHCEPHYRGYEELKK